MKFGRGVDLLEGFHIVEAGVRVDTTLGAIRLVGSENHMNARQIDWSGSHIGSKWILVRGDFAGFRQLQGHLHVSGNALVFNWFPGDSITAVRQCGAHLLLVAPGSDISSVERVSKKKMLGSGLKHGGVGFTLEHPQRTGRIHFALTSIGEDEAVADTLLACANAAQGTNHSWPSQPGEHKIAFDATSN